MSNFRITDCTEKGNKTKMTEYELIIDTDVHGNLCFIDSTTGECIIKIPKGHVQGFITRIISVVTYNNS